MIKILALLAIFVFMVFGVSVRIADAAVQVALPITASDASGTPQQETRTAISMSRLPGGISSFDVLVSIVPCEAGSFRSISMPDYGTTSISRLTSCSIVVSAVDTANLLSITNQPTELFRAYIFAQEASVATIDVTVISLLDDALVSPLLSSTNGTLTIATDVNRIEELPIWTQKSRSYETGVRERRQVLSTGAINYQDELNIWQEVDVSATEPISGLGFMYTKLPYSLRLDNDANWQRVIFPIKNQLSAWIRFDMPEPVSDPIRSGDGLFIWDMGNYSYQLAVTSGSVKFDIILHNNSAPLSYTIPFSMQNLTLVDNIILYQGTPVGELRDFVAFDSSVGPDEEFITRSVDTQITADEIILTLDDTDMVYPITIDPTFSIGASADDAWENANDGTMDLTDTRIEFGWVGEQKHVGLRFTGISGLSGTTITTAQFTFRAEADDSGDFESDFYTQDADTCGTFTTTTSNISDTGQRPRSTAVVQADGTDFGNWTDTQDHTLDVVSIVQERADEGDPTELCFLNIYQDGTGERAFQAYDAAGSEEPQIEIVSSGAAARRVIFISRNNLMPRLRLAA